MWDSSTYCNVDRPLDLCDVALVMLNAPSAMPDLDIADEHELSEWGEGSAARAYGYGRMSETATRTSDYLKRAYLTITDLRENHYTMWAADTTWPITDLETARHIGRRRNDSWTSTTRNGPMPQRPQARTATRLWALRYARVTIIDP